MNSDTVIKVEGLSKKYRLGSPTKYKYKALRDVITGIFTAPFQGRVKRKEKDFIWALKNMSFEVKRGEVVGIIGRNGAGKTTLLKILSRITPPTEGYARIRGRVGSLLEVGTGFHPELTGRENIYLSGAILGMKKREIDKKFDEIVDFSELEKFLDTPVKFYSSGMFVRLAFAVAAHLEPEILLVDEVLAVGDAAFQKKCLGKMGDVAKEGRTVLFVSHNMGAIQKLCETVIWLQDGEIYRMGPSFELINGYLERTVFSTPSLFRRRNQDAVLDQAPAYYTEIRLLDSNGREARVFQSDGSMTIEIHLKVRSPVTVQCGVDIVLPSGMTIINVNSKLLGHYPLYLDEDSIVKWRIAELRLTPGRYSVNLRLKDSAERNFLDFVENAAVFEVIGADVYRTGHVISSRQGVTYLPIHLEISPFRLC